MFKKILVPTDGSTLAQSAATIAAQLAKSQGAQVVGVYVIDPFPYIGIGDASAVGLQAYMAEARSAAGQALEALGKVCKEEGVPFAGDTIERNVVYEGVIETAKAGYEDGFRMFGHSLIVAPSGEMFMTDGYGNARVHKFAADGTHLFSWGEPGTAPGQFNLPHAVWIDGQWIWDGYGYVWQPGAWVLTRPTHRTH